jgi:hypothetical protein
MPFLRPRVSLKSDSGTARIPVAASLQGQDSLLSAIIKWIPVEILTVFKTVDGFVPVEKYGTRLILGATFMFLTPLWIGYATHPEGKPVAWRQVILAPVAFCLWAIAMLGDPLKYIFVSWNPWMGSVSLGIGTLLLPIFDGLLRSLGVKQE